MNFRGNFLVYTFVDTDVRRWKRYFFVKCLVFILLKVCSRHTSIYFLGRTLPQGKMQYSVHNLNIYFESDDTQLPRNVSASTDKNIILCFFYLFVSLFLCLFFGGFLGLGRLEIGVFMENYEVF